MSGNKIKRNSSLELLRVMSILMIILSHYCYHGGIDVLSLPFGFNKIILQISYLGNLGVNIFFLISSYFMYKNKFNLKKIIMILFEVFSYSIIIYLIFIFINKESFTLINFIKNMFPVLFKIYWFATVYLIIYILSPYINILINKMNQKEHLKIIIIFLIIWSILPTISKIDLYSNYFTDVLILYLISAYINKYQYDIHKYFSKIKKLTIISVVSLIGITILFNYNSFLNNYISQLYTRNSLFIIIISTGLFIMFLNKNYYSKFINIMASTTFGIYLLHDNYLIRTVLWPFINSVKYQFSPYLIIHMIFWVISIWIVCVLIELIRKNTIQKLANNIINKLDKINLVEKIKLKNHTS